MKRLICVLFLTMFSAAYFAGCRAEVEAGDEASSGHTTMKKTTTYDPNAGRSETKIETHTNP